jgi:hypothetical protein
MQREYRSKPPSDQTMVFPGTPEQAEAIYKTNKKKLTPQEEFILLRYLGLEIPPAFNQFFFSMDDHAYPHTLSRVLSKLPQEAKREM